MEFTTRERRTRDGAYSVDITGPEPLGYGCAGVWKGKMFSRALDAVVWEPALVRYTSIGETPLDLLALHLSAITYAMSIAAALDAKHPAGSVVQDENPNEE